MHWELQEHHRLIPNEPLQAGLDENSWMHGCRKELFLLISKCVRVRHSKHIYFAFWLLARAQDCLEVYGNTTGKTALYETFFPSQWLGSLFEVGMLINSKWVGFFYSWIRPGDCRLRIQIVISRPVRISTTTKGLASTMIFNLWFGIDGQRKLPLHWCSWHNDIFFNNWERELSCCLSYVLLLILDTGW